MVRAVGSVVAWALFALAPGVGLLLCARPGLRSRPALVVGAAPAVTFGLLFLVAQALAMAGIGPWPLAPVLGLAVVGTAAVVRLARHRTHATPPSPARVPDSAAPDAFAPDAAAPDAPAASPEASPGAGERRAAALMGAAAVVVGAAIWAWSMGGLPSVPPNRDSQNHAYFVARIVEEDTIDPGVVLAESPGQTDSVASFYPLALHTDVAVARQVTGLAVPDLLLAWTLLSAVVVLPLGLFALVRRLVPDRPLAAGLTALVTPLVGLFPYQPITWGGLAVIIGLALVPGAVALALWAVEDRGVAPLGLAAVALAGVVLVHSSQVALLVVLLVPFLVADLLRSRRDQPAAVPGPWLVAAATPWALLAAGTAILLAPSVLGLLTGAGERADHSVVPDLGLLDGAGHLFNLDVGSLVAQPVLGLLALVGLVTSFRSRRLRPLAVGATVLVLLYLVGTQTGQPWALGRPLTRPWYMSWWRLAYNVALLVPVFVGLALDTARTEVRRRAGTSSRAIAVASCAVLALIGLRMTDGPSALVSAAFRTQALLGTEETDLMADLAERPDATGTILNQENDGTTWMYALEGLTSLSAIQAFRQGQDAEDRAYLLDHIADAATDRRVADLLDRWDIRYLLVNDRTYMREPAALTVDELRAAPGITVVDHRGSMWLFRVDPAGA